MTVLMGVLARCLYAIGDIALYRGVLGYEFSESALRNVCGGLFLVGFLGAMAVLPGAEYIEWVMYGMLWLGMMLLFKKLQFGLVVFVFFARMTLSNLMDNMVWYFKGEDSLWGNIDVIIIMHSLIALFIILVLIIFNRKKRYLSRETITNNRYTIWLGVIVMFVAASSYYWSGNISEELIQEIANKMRIKDSLIGIALVCIFAVTMISNERQKKLTEQITINNRCIREQTEQYRILNEKQKELRAFRHDIKGHILAMRRMAAQGSSQELAAYLEKWAGLQEETFYISSNNIIGDAIFNFYYDKGCREGIEVKVMGKFLQDMDVAETDLCIVLTNTVSNAYEAALKCGKGSIVTIELSQLCGKAMIVITNPVKEEPKIQGGIMSTTKADKELHGLGISNTMKALEKYDGQITWEKKGDEIVTKIVI